MSCPHPIGFLEKDGDIIPVSCNRWSCPVCGRRKKYLVAKRVHELFKESDNNIMAITLTQKLGSKQNIMRNWNHFRIKMNRLGYKFDTYFWSKEFTKKGERHLHIITDCGYIKQSEISRIWKQITKGESYIVWINEENINNPAGYATKYLTKSYSKEMRFNKKEHRYGFSRNSMLYLNSSASGISFLHREMSSVRKFNLEYHPSDYYENN